MLSRARTEQTLTDMAHDLKGPHGDQERRTIRSRAARLLAMWSPRRRRVQRLEVVGTDGEVIRDDSAAAGELDRQLGLVLSESVGVSGSARDRFLAFARSLEVAMRRLSRGDFVDVIHCVRDSALGPDGLPCRAWLAGGSVVEQLCSAYLGICGGSNPPARFNAALLTFIPKAMSLIATTYVAEPARYRPLSLSNTVHKFLAKALNRTLEAYCLEAVRPRPARICQPQGHGIECCGDSGHDGVRQPCWRADCRGGLV